MGRRYVDVIYEDRDVIVVNKPRGVVVVAENKADDSLTSHLRAYLLSKFKGARGVFIKALHRLDKETTGLVIFVKSKDGERLIDDMKGHLVKRRYIAVVEGAVEKEDGTIDMPLEKGDFGYGRKVGIAEKGEGTKAVTHYHVRERYEKATMLELDLETGRTHQIRVHLSAIGHPLIGDKVYNPHGRTKFPRQALHAAELNFRHPTNGKRMELVAPLPKDMDELIDRLRETV